MTTREKVAVELSWWKSDAEMGDCVKEAEKIAAIYAEERLAWDEERKTLGDGIDYWRGRAEKAEAREAALRKALEWYAIPSHYISSSAYMGGGQGPTPADIDGGQRAHAALAMKEAQHDDA